MRRVQNFLLAGEIDRPSRDNRSAVGVSLTHGNFYWSEVVSVFLFHVAGEEGGGAESQGLWSSVEGCPAGARAGDSGDSLLLEGRIDGVRKGNVDGSCWSRRQRWEW